MGEAMTRRQRLLAVLAGEATDRVPVLAGHFNEWAEDWKAGEPSYRRLVDFCRQRCDGILSWGPRAQNETGLLTSSRAVRCERQSRTLEDGSEETLETVHTPRGPLTRRFRRHPSAATVWEVEHLLKTPEDVEALLEIPYEAVAYDLAGFAAAERAIGDAGLVLGEMADALCLAASMFEFGTFTVMALTEPELFGRLMDYFDRGVTDRLAAMLTTPVRFIRIYGPEYATPPYLPPHLFDRYVVDYDRRHVEAIHRAGARVRIHSHGRVREALAKFAALGADATDPVEAPPAGDVTLAEARRLLGDRLTIFGNLQLHDLETMSRDEVVRLTRQTLEEGAPGGRFALQPTAEPITVPLNPKLEENWMAYIETGLDYRG